MSKLIVIVVVAVTGLILFTLLSLTTLNNVKVGGPLYKQAMMGKDLVADIQPPPLYLIEGYLLARSLRLPLSPEEKTATEEGLRKARREFDRRARHWLAHLPEGDEKRRLLISRVIPTAKALFHAVDSQLIPATESGDLILAQKLLDGPIRQKYLRHRAAIDALVSSTHASTEKVEASVMSAIRGEILALATIAGLVALAMALFAVLWLRSVPRAEAALRASEERYELAAQGSGAGLWDWIIDTNTVYMSPVFKDMLGYDDVGLPSTQDGFVRILHPDDKEIWAKALQAHLETSVAFDVEYRLLHKSGEYRWFQARGKAIRDARGKPYRMAGSLVDVTERKRAEGSVLKERGKAEQYLRIAEVIFVAMDSEAKITLLNRKGHQMLGYAEGDLNGRDWFKICLPPNEYQQVLHVYREIMAGNLQPFEYYENHILTRTGEKRFIAWHNSVIRDENGRIQGTFSSGEDITERRLAEEKVSQLYATLEQRVADRTAQLHVSVKELQAFSYSVSHDLRAPLRGIDGWSLVLLEDYADKLDAQGMEYLRLVRSETQRMGHIIDDMLNLSRVTQMEMKVASVDLSEMAVNILARLRDSHPDRKMECVVESGLEVMGDAGLLGMALDNMLENAWKFTQGKKDARVEFGRMVKDGESVFYLSDTGAGFDMAHAKKLFQPFQRMHKYSEFPGTGIGLATVQRVIERHGGRIWAQAQVNAGATFFFTLPAGGSQILRLEEIAANSV